MKHISRNYLWYSFFFLLLLILTCLTFRSVLPWFWLDAPFDKFKSTVMLQSDNDSNEMPAIFPLRHSARENLTTISVRFKPSEFQKNMVIFQTARYHRGISAEIDKKGILSIYGGAQNKKRYLVSKMQEEVTANEWHTLNISAWQGHTIRAEYDGIPSIWFYRMENTDPAIHYRLSHLKVGAGDAPSQDFIGEVKDFKVTTKIVDLSHRHVIDHWINNFIIFLSVLAFAIFTMLGLQKMERQDKIEFLSAFVLVGFFAAIIFHYILGAYWGATYPRNTFLEHGLPEFSDLYVSLLQDWTFAPYTSEVVHAQYFPFAYVLIYPFVMLNIHLAAMIYLLLFCIALFMLVNFYLKKNTPTYASKLAKLKNVFILSFLTYPFLFNIERANLENCMFIFVALSFYFYGKQRRFLPELLIAMASAIKLYPLLFAVFFYAEKQYRRVLLSGVLTILLIVVSLFLFHSSFVENFHNWMLALWNFENLVAFQPDRCIKFNLGLWGLIKYVLIYWQHVSTSQLMQAALIYHKYVLVCLPLLIVYVVLVEKIAWRRIALLAFAIMLFPEVSNDYKLIYLYIPLAGFLWEKPARGDLFYLILFGLLLIPKNYYMFREDVSIANLINQAVILLMSFSIIGEGLYKKYLRKII